MHTFLRNYYLLRYVLLDIEDVGNVFSRTICIGKVIDHFSQHSAKIVTSCNLPDIATSCVFFTKQCQRRAIMRQRRLLWVHGLQRFLSVFFNSVHIIVNSHTHTHTRTHAQVALLQFTLDLYSLWAYTHADARAMQHTSVLYVNGTAGLDMCHCQPNNTVVLRPDESWSNGILCQRTFAENSKLQGSQPLPWRTCAKLDLPVRHLDERLGPPAFCPSACLSHKSWQPDSYATEIQSLGIIFRVPSLRHCQQWFFCQPRCVFKYSYCI